MAGFSNPSKETLLNTRSLTIYTKVLILLLLPNQSTQLQEDSLEDADWVREIGEISRTVEVLLSEGWHIQLSNKADDVD